MLKAYKVAVAGYKEEGYNLEFAESCHDARISQFHVLSDCDYTLCVWHVQPELLDNQEYFMQFYSSNRGLRCVPECTICREWWHVLVNGICTTCTTTQNDANVEIDQQPKEKEDDWYLKAVRNLL